MITLDPTTSLVIRVAAASPVPAVAGSIAATLRQHGCADVQAIGAGAVNQAVKALAVAAQFMAHEGQTLVCVPEFVQKDIDGAECTAIRFAVTMTEVEVTV